MTKAEYIEFHKKFCEDMVEITKKKNADYTGGDSDPFANFEGISHLVKVPSVVEIGFLTRMSDKMARIGSFITNGTLQVKDESVTDTLKDLANYAALFAGYLESKKAAQIPEETLRALSERRDQRVLNRTGKTAVATIQEMTEEEAQQLSDEEFVKWWNTASQVLEDTIENTFPTISP